MFGQRMVKLVTLNIEEVPSFPADEYHYGVREQSTFTYENNGIPEVLQTSIPCRITHFRKRTPHEELDTYLAIHPDVKEELALLQVPDMVEGINEKHNATMCTLKKTILQRTTDINELRNECNNKALLLASIKDVPWYVRLKWVFTGVDYVS